MFDHLKRLFTSAPILITPDATRQFIVEVDASDDASAGFLRPLPIPSPPWSHIALDFVTGLPPSAGNTVVLTVVDRFSKAAHFIPLPKLPSAKETAQLMVDHVFKIHGLPTDVVSDRGPQFTSQFWGEFCRLIGASSSLSSGFHPQTNVQAERTNQILGRMLRSLTSPSPASWCDQLSWAEYAHNSLPLTATGLSPFHACLGYQPPLFTCQENESSVPSVQAFIQRCRRTWRRVRSALCRSRARTRRAANRHRVKAPRYVCVQKVWLSTQNLLLQVSSRKLMPRFIWPFSIVKVLSPVAVKLRLSHQLRRVHPTYPVSNLLFVFPPVHLLPLMRGLPFTGYGGCLTFVLGGGATSFWWIRRGTVLRKGGGSRPGTSWIARSSTISTVLVSLLLRERLEALVEGGVLS